MKKLIMLFTLVLSANVYASTTVIVCESRMGDAVNTEKNISDSTVYDHNKVIRFKHGVLEGIVQYKNERIIQMMIENTQNYTFTQIGQKALEQSNNSKGYVFMQDLKNDGQFMEISCEVIK